jgi:hypothetical protein
VDDRAIHVHHRGVVREMSTAPFAALRSAEVSESIIHAAVEADVRAPIASVEHVYAFIPAPITGRPEHANARGGDPDSGHSVISIVAISPISGSPHIALDWTRRLLVHRQRGRSYPNRSPKKPGTRGGRYKKSQRLKQKSPMKTYVRRILPSSPFSTRPRHKPEIARHIEGKKPRTYLPKGVVLRRTAASK